MSDENPKRAFVLLRHGIDFDKHKSPGIPEHKLWEYHCSEHNEDGAANCSKKDRWNYYFKDPKAEKVQIRVRRLNCEGRRQSWQLVKALPKWLAEHKYYPVRRVVTKDPRQPNYEERTQNPFQTVYPLVHALEKNDDPNYVRLKFMDHKYIPQNELTHDALVDQRGNYSTLICWDCQGMWGEKSEVTKMVDGKEEQVKAWPSSPADESIFKILIPGKVTSRPDKGEDIYIITYDSEHQKFELADQIKLSDLVNKYAIQDSEPYKKCKEDYK